MMEEERVYIRDRRVSSVNGTVSWTSVNSTVSWTATCERMKLNHHITLYTKLNFKWVKHIDVKPNTRKYIEGAKHSIILVSRI